MTDRYADLRDLLDLTQTNVFNRDDVRALLADYDRMRDALTLAREYVSEARAQEEDVYRGQEAVSDLDQINADLAQIDAALAQEQGGSDGKA
jgi:hypothetical protein